MEGFFGKFGIYDFMGIWGPGAITVTYFYFTMKKSITMFLNFIGIVNPDISETYLLLILYTMVAYFVGVVLHEVSKLIVERLNSFEIQKIKSFAYNGTRHKGIGCHIKNHYKEAIESNILDEGEYQKLNFDKAMCCLKYTNKTGTARIDRYHSVYALARSLAVCFMSHSIICLVSAMVENNASREVSSIIMLDLVLFFVFSERTYRYLCLWIENTFIQYYLLNANSGSETLVPDSASS